MTILVTGGAGYIGSHMLYELLDKGEQPIVIDNLSTGFSWAIPEKIPLIQGDFGDEELVRGLIERYSIQEIIHFAAKIVVPESITDPLGYYLNNTAKARNLLSCAVSGGVKRFIFSSTAAIYGNPERVPVVETASPNPMSPYGRSKLMVEWMLEDVAKASSLTYGVLRYFNVCGADPQGRVGQSTQNATHLMKVAVQTALGMRPYLEVFGTDYPTPDGTCLRDYIHVTDLVRAHADALHYLRQGGESFTCNVGYQHGYSVREVIEVVKRVSGVDFNVHYAPRRPGDPAAIIAANTEIKSRLGWQPQHNSIEQMVQHALDWERRLHNRIGDTITPPG